MTIGGWIGGRLWGSVLVLCCAMGSARAEFGRAGSSQTGSSQSEKAAADALFDAARTLMKQGNYAEACPKLADSHRLDPGTGTLLNLGRCYALNGQTASAWTTYREAAARARAEGQTEREALAREEASKLEPRLTRVVINVSKEAAAPGLAVLRDGQSLPQGSWGVPLPVDPGEHTVTATAPGRVTHTAKFEAVGEGATIAVVVPPLSEEPTAAAPAGDVAPVPARAPSNQTEAVAPAPAVVLDEPAPQVSNETQRVLGYVAGALGVAGFLAGGAIMLRANSQNEEAKDICPGDQATRCPEKDIARHDNLTEAARTNFTRSYIAFGVGGALVATGAVLLFTSGSDSRSASRDRQLVVSAQGSPVGAGVQVQGSFW